MFYIKNREIKNSLEIDTITIIEDIYNKLDRKWNKVSITDSQNLRHNKINVNYTDDNGSKIDEVIELALISFACKKFGENFKSIISEQLYFLYKTVYHKS